MVKNEEIDGIAIAHAQWKKNFMHALSGGQSGLDPEAVRRDDVCQFGKWLGAISPEDAQNEHFILVKGLHTDFHKKAGEIADVFVAGERDEALRRIESGEPYSGLTGKLALALRAWKSEE